MIDYRQNDIVVELAREGLRIRIAREHRKRQYIRMAQMQLEELERKNLEAQAIIGNPFDQ